MLLRGAVLVLEDERRDDGLAMEEGEARQWFCNGEDGEVRRWFWTRGDGEERGGFAMDKRERSVRWRFRIG